MKFHVGSYLKDYCDDCGITYDEFSKDSGIDKQTLLNIINEKHGLNEKIITKISSYTGTSENLWSNLDKKYYEWKKNK